MEVLTWIKLQKNLRIDQNWKGVNIWTITKQKGNFLRGTIIHSSQYKNAKAVKEKAQNVVVVGAANSAVDILVELDVEDLTLYQSVKSCDKGINFDKINVIDRIKEFKSDGIITNDGKFIACEMVILATGYDYNFSFLQDGVLDNSDKFVTPLFMHVLHKKYPNSLAFVGLNQRVIPFPLFDDQIRMVQHVWFGSELDNYSWNSKNMPSNLDIEKWSKIDDKYRRENNLINGHAHYFDFTLYRKYVEDVDKIIGKKNVPDYVLTYMKQQVKLERNHRLFIKIIYIILQIMYNIKF